MSDLPERVKRQYWAEVRRRLRRAGHGGLAIETGIIRYKDALRRERVGDLFYHAPVDETVGVVIEIIAARRGG
jgi:transposase